MLPQLASDFRNGSPVDLNPGSNQVQGVGQEAGGAAGGHGRETLDRQVRDGGVFRREDPEDLLEEVVERPPRRAAGDVGAQRGHVAAVEPPEPVFNVDRSAERAEEKSFRRVSRV